MIPALASTVLLALSLSPLAVREPALPEGLSAADMSCIRSAYDARRHDAVQVEGGYEASNAGQRWWTTFDGEGVTVEPDSAQWTWGLELVRWGFAEAELAVESALVVRADGQRVSYEWGEGLEEWYVNDRRGLEHGYTVLERPPGDGGELAITLAVRGALVLEPTDDGRGARFVTRDGVAVLTYGGLVVRDADGRELEARIERAGANLRISLDEDTARYPITIDPVAQQAYLKASNAKQGDQFGRDVAVSGDTVVVGAPWAGGSEGKAYVFVRSGATWTEEAVLQASNGTGEDLFGWSVSISGDTIVIGAPGATCCYAGKAYVFERSGTTWTETAILSASPWDADDLLGASVSISGDTIVLGAYGEDSGATGVDGDPFDDSVWDSGAAYVYVRNGSAWSLQAYLKASNTGEQDYFGWSVCCSGDTLVVGACYEDSSATGVDGDQSDDSQIDAGAAYVFVRDALGWSQRAYLKPSNTDAGDNFGWSIACAGDTLLVGSPTEDGGATGVDGDPFDNSSIDSGAGYLFEPIGTSWIQRAYFKASNTDANDQFGWTVSLDGASIVIGACLEDSSATGTNGDQDDEAAPDSGAAYLFAIEALKWSQTAYLKASNAEAGDVFGWSATVSGDTVLVGALGEDSSAQGVDGDQDDNSASAAGAAYVFDLDAPCATTYCGSSQNPANAALVSIDTCNSASPSITLGLSNGPPFQFAYLLVGDGSSTISQPPGSAGDLCIAGGSCLGRYDRDSGQIDGAGTFATDIVNALSVPCGGGVTILPGTTWNFQFWHRQPMGLPSTFSEAISVTFE